MNRPTRNCVAVLSFAVCLGAVTVAQDIPKGSGSKIERIVADESLFPKDFAAKVDWKGMPADSRWKLWTAVPEPHRPKLAEILQKYGKEQSMVDELAPALKSGSVESTDPQPPAGVPTRKVKVYYYDHIGFAVDAGEHDPRVLLITNRPILNKR